MTKTIFDLPKGLLKKIISRIPLKSMRAVRLTCKRWNNLSKSRGFSKKHLPESRMIVMMDYNLNNLYLMRIVDVNENLSTEPLGKLTCLNDSEQVKVSQAFYSEGFLLCILKDDIVVWNPYSGQTRWIKPKYSHHEPHLVRYALGYVPTNNKSGRSHKILSFSRSEYEIYDLESDLWTSIDVTPHWKLSFDQPGGVSLNGNTYWCATKGNSQDGDKLDDHIICFDFTSERFGPLMPLPFRAGQNDYVALSGVGEEKLAVIRTHNEINPYEIEIWITTRIEAGKKLSWSKFLAVNTKPHYTISSKCSFIDEEKKLAIGFIDLSHTTIGVVGGAGYLRQLDLRERADKNYHSQCVCSYVPSLVQIKQGKRKEHSNLAKSNQQEVEKEENESQFTVPNLCL